MAPRILFVGADKAISKILLALLPVAENAGAQIFIASEALTTVALEVAGWVPNIKGPPSDTAVPFELDFGTELERLAPDVVVTGQSRPIFLERGFAEAASQRGIPVVTVEDTWRGCRRLLAPVSLCLVVDTYSASLARVDFPQAQVVVVGNIGAPTEAQLQAYRQPIPELEAEKEAGQQIIFYAGGNLRTAPELNFLRRCLEMTTGHWRLVTRWHPKRCNSIGPDGRTYGEFWEDLVKPLGDRYLGTLPTVSVTEQITVNSDVVVASFMNSTIAGVLGKINIVLGTPESMKEAVEELGLTDYPQAVLGLAHKLVEPTNLLACPRPMAEARRAVQPFNAELAYQLISDLAK